MTVMAICKNRSGVLCAICHECQFVFKVSAGVQRCWQLKEPLSQAKNVHLFVCLIFIILPQSPTNQWPKPGPTELFAILVADDTLRAHLFIAVGRVKRLWLEACVTSSPRWLWESLCELCACCKALYRCHYNETLTEVDCEWGYYGLVPRWSQAALVDGTITAFIVQASNAKGSPLSFCKGKVEDLVGSWLTFRRSTMYSKRRKTLSKRRQILL
jgi:hypothetical protein